MPSRSVSVSQGKGLDLPQAMASALMEACEGFHAEEIAPCRHASYRDLARDETVVEPDQALKEKARVDLKPGEESKLRIVEATFHPGATDVSTTSSAAYAPLQSGQGVATAEGFYP